jgi:hypothetical protein
MAVYTCYTNLNSTAKFLSYGRHRARQVLDYRTVPTQTSEHTGNFLLLLIFGNCKIIKGVFHLDISFFCQFRVISVLLCAFRVSKPSTTDAEAPDDCRSEVFVEDLGLCR